MRFEFFGGAKGLAGFERQVVGQRWRTWWALRAEITCGAFASCAVVLVIVGGAPRLALAVAGVVGERGAATAKVAALALA